MRINKRKLYGALIIVVVAILFYFIAPASLKAFVWDYLNDSSSSTYVEDVPMPATESAYTTVATTSSEPLSTNSTITPTRELDYDFDVSALSEVDSDYLLSLEYDGYPMAVVNGNEPYFMDDNWCIDSIEVYSELDSLGRTQTAFACLSPDTMPPANVDREALYTSPSGWRDSNGRSNNRQYDSELINGGWVYNRCHLIGYQLSAENDNPFNLVTGTRYLNIDGMLENENAVADYIRRTGNHVMYRITPIYYGDELVCRGLLMEAVSVEDNGSGICYCIYCFNVQPGIYIDYATGANHEI